MAGDNVPWLHRLTLYLLLSKMQTNERIDAIKRWASSSGWRTQFEGLQTDREFLDHFANDEQKALKESAALVLDTMRAWDTRVPVKDWVLWPVYMAMPPVLVSIALWFIGEPVFALRSHPYYAIFLLTLLQCSRSPYVNVAVFKRLHRDFGATTPFPALLFSVAAFIPGCRDLYHKTWYLAISILGTVGLIYWIQFHHLLKDLRAKTQPQRRGKCDAEAERQVLTKLVSIKELFDDYTSRFSHFRCNYIHNIQDGLIREGAGKAIEIMAASLSPEARQRHQSVSERQIKRWFTYGYFAAAAVTIGTLIFQWGSFVQAIIATVAVGGMLILLVSFEHYTVDAFLDFYTAKMAFLFWSFFFVNSLLLGNTRRFSDNHRLFWAIYAVMFFVNFFCSDIVVHYAKQYLKEKSLRKQTIGSVSFPGRADR